MPIGLVPDSEFERELESLTRQNKEVTRTPTSDRPVTTIEPLTPSHGRSEGDVNVPDSLRKIIGETSVIEGRQAALGLAGMFGISPSSVSAYAKGATSTTTYHEPKKSIIDHINKSRRKHIKRASHVLNTALEAITQDKLDYTDAKDLAGIAKDMSVIIKNLEPPAEAAADVNDKQAPQFVIYAPQFRDERSFESITVNE